MRTSTILSSSQRICRHRSLSHSRRKEPTARAVAAGPAGVHEDGQESVGEGASQDSSLLSMPDTWTTALRAVPPECT
eukprot:1721914-Prymnesium_polylepis.1